MEKVYFNFYKKNGVWLYNITIMELEHEQYKTKEFVPNIQNLDELKTIIEAIKKLPNAYINIQF